MTFIATIKNSGFSFGSEYNRHRFLLWAKKNPGKRVKIVEAAPISHASRGYFEGALVPFYCDWSDKYDPLNEEHCDEVRELFKAYFNGKWTEGLDGKPTRIAQSTTKLSRDEFKSEFIQKIVDYFMENQIPVPNPNLYKLWRDTYAVPGERYFDWLKRLGLQCDATCIPSDIQKQLHEQQA